MWYGVKHFACSLHAYIFLFFTHILFVVNHTINATSPERLQQHPLLFATNCTDRAFFVWRLNSARPSHPGHSSILMRSEIPSGMCAKLRTMAASNIRDHASQSLLFLPACSTHTYFCSSRTSRSWWITQSTQHHRRGCNRNKTNTLGRLHFWHMKLFFFCLFSAHSRQCLLSFPFTRMCSYTYCSSFTTLQCSLTCLLLHGEMACLWSIRHSAKRWVYRMHGRFIRPICRKWHCGYQCCGCKKSIKYQNSVIIVSDWLGQLCNHCFTLTLLLGKNLPFQGKIVSYTSSFLHHILFMVLFHISQLHSRFYRFHSTFYRLHQRKYIFYCLIKWKYYTRRVSKV